MRDALVLLIVFVGCIGALRRPWVGIMLWTWLSIMNPHRFSWGAAYDAPVAFAAALCTLIGTVFTKDKGSPFKESPSIWLALFFAWMTLSWLFGLDPSDDYPQWNKVAKIYLMTLVGLALLQTRMHIHSLLWVSVGSIAVLAVKGGIFTLATGGNHRVWGPPGSFIADNNEMALATIMTIPLLRFIQMQYHPGWRRHVISAAMLLAAAAALGSYSRGAILALAAMAVMLWWRGGRSILGGAAIALVAASLIAFMPGSWEARISSIGTYEEDRSAMGRISAWWTAIGVARDFPLGVGFNFARPELFASYSPYPDLVQGAHSIYFLVLGNHGFLGFLLWIAIFLSTYRMAGALRLEGRRRPETAWCSDLGAMCQVSLVGFAVGGAFLSLSYFDLPYNIMMVVVLSKWWMRNERWNSEARSQGFFPQLLALDDSKSSDSPSAGTKKQPPVRAGYGEPLR